jgi:UDP-N-acetylmuramyl pentapeptide phosphotransferase/UDP-N-acetylglucosamine-1-phosphate transferase
MKAGAFLGLTLLAIAIFLWDWRKLSRQSLGLRSAFIAITLLGWGLAVLLVYFPELPGPTQLVDTIFKPLGKTLE